MNKYFPIKVLKSKITEAFTSVLPILLIVLILQATPFLNLTLKECLLFVFCAIALIIGIALFNLGADMAMTPMGDHVGSGLSRTGRLGLLLGVSFFMGVLITVAEPDLSVLASQVADIINSTLLLVTVGIGVGLFLTIAILKIVFRIQLSTLLMFFYMIVFALISLMCVVGNKSLTALSMDSGGVTTGPITVPFLMALGVGIAQTMGGRNVSENSFGLISLCSVGPIVAVLILGLTGSGSVNYVLADYSIPDKLLPVIFKTLAETSKEVIIALGLIVIFFFVLQFFLLHLPKKKLSIIGIGIFYTFIGLVVFLSAAKIGFLPIGFSLGNQLGVQNPIVVIVFSLVLGAVVVLAEPAVHVLNEQVESVTNGAVTKKQMIIALSCGVGISIALSIIRIIFNFSVLFYVIPGYFISLGLSFFIPGVYTSIAFDSGGVASGPLTSTFILPFAIGVCTVTQGENSILELAFGVVAMVAMTPLITIQLLGFKSVVQKKVHDKVSMQRILNASDEQIIEF